MLELQRQVASLKHKLNHTEETQKDFVELSQSLQVSTVLKDSVRVCISVHCTDEVSSDGRRNTEKSRNAIITLISFNMIANFSEYFLFFFNKIIIMVVVKNNTRTS